LIHSKKLNNLQYLTIYELYTLIVSNSLIQASSRVIFPNLQHYHSKYYKKIQSISFYIKEIKPKIEINFSKFWFNLEKKLTKMHQLHKNFYEILKPDKRTIVDINFNLFKKVEKGHFINQQDLYKLGLRIRGKWTAKKLIKRIHKEIFMRNQEKKRKKRKNKKTLQRIPIL